MLRALFFKTYYSYLLGDFESTRLYFELLRQEFRETNNRDAYSQGQLRKLKEIKVALDSGVIAKNEWVEEESPVGDTKEGAGLKQDALVKRIHFEALDQLKEILSDDELFLYNLEHPCAPYGRVDMLYRGRNTSRRSQKEHRKTRSRRTDLEV